jgi:uncharacterized protein YigE (DUF2233 family)
LKSTNGSPWRLAGAALIAVTLVAGDAGVAHAQPRADLCRPVTHAGASFTVCTVDLRRHELKLFLKSPDGDPYGSFSRLTRSQPGLLFAMNAGMYHEDRSPVGLYVENGQELKGANTRPGPGNFHMKPNGIFYAAGTNAGVLETSRFLKARPKADIATQSGPMLVIDGKLHPKFSETSASLKVRNGVGVRDAATVMFAISEEPVSFAAFARLFRDALKCRNALFLDGSISSLYVPGQNRGDALRAMGPIVGAVERRR